MDTIEIPHDSLSESNPFGPELWNKAIKNFIMSDFL